MDECEESQLEAAIRASLAETQAENKPYYLIDSDDQSSPGTPGDDDNEEVCVRRKATTDRMPQGSKCIDSTSSDDERVPSPFAHHTPSDINFDSIDDSSTSVDCRERGRKRHRSFETNGDVPRKLLKQIVSSRLDDCKPEQHEDEVRRKGKEKAGSLGVPRKAKDLPPSRQTLEEQLALGTVSASDVAVLLVRLPDGTRVEKAFYSTHPIQVRMSFWPPLNSTMFSAIILVMRALVYLVLYTGTVHWYL